MTRRVLLAALVFLVTLAIYVSTATWAKRTTSPAQAYFDHLAQSFLHGRLDLPSPPSRHDLTLHDGRWYVPFPPLPALALVPWVALFGLAHTSTIFLCAVFGSASAGLVFHLLEGLSSRGVTQLRRPDNLWLTALFAFGTVEYYMALTGAVWFLGQVLSVTFLAAAANAALRGSAYATGAFLGCAMLGRPHLVLAWPMLCGLALCSATLSTRAQRRDWAVRSLIPAFVATAVLLAYNRARFGDALDFGYATERVANDLSTALTSTGQFSIRYLPRNLWVALFSTPAWDPRCHLPVPRATGMSILLTTPAFLLLLRLRDRSPAALGSALGLGLLLVPLLTYYNTGWIQFGYRFTLDFLVPLMILLALAMRDRMGWTARALILASIGVNAVGVAWWLGRWCRGG